jgi:hypothetical protein
MCEVGRVHRSIIATLKDLIEDVSALSSPEYLESVEEVRNDYREGRVKHLEELFDV